MNTSHIWTSDTSLPSALVHLLEQLYTLIPCRDTDSIGTLNRLWWIYTFFKWWTVSRITGTCLVPTLVGWLEWTCDLDCTPFVFLDTCTRWTLLHSWWTIGLITTLLNWWSTIPIWTSNLLIRWTDDLRWTIHEIINTSTIWTS